jgi:hypothetical protein
MPNVSQPEIAQREANLIAAIETRLPEFAKACHDLEIPTVILHQDSFAGDYQEEGYRLLGMAIKFAGIYGREVRVCGTNRGTFGQIQTIH